MNALICRYCGKSLNGQKPFHRSGNVFCNVQESVLYEHAETFTIPPYPKDNPFPVKPMNLLFEEEL